MTDTPDPGVAPDPVEPQIDPTPSEAPFPEITPDPSPSEAPPAPDVPDTGRPYAEV